MPIEFYLICLFVIGLFGGWIARVDYMQYKADQEREERAEKDRKAWEENKEFIKQINRNNTFNSWVAETKGDAK